MFTLSIKLPDLVMLYAQIDCIRTRNIWRPIFNEMLIFEFQRFHKESWSMVCSLICNL